MEEKSLKSKALSGAIWRTLENACTHMVSTIVSIVLARILVPDDYAVVGVVAIVFSFCNLFLSNGLSSALVQRKANDDHEYSSVLTVNLAISAVLYGTIFIAAPSLSNLYKIPELSGILKAMGITFFINSFKAIPSAKINIEMDYKKYFWSSLLGTVISAVVGVMLALNGAGAWALLAQQITDLSVDTIVLYLVTKTKLSFYFSLNKIKPLFSFGWKLFAINVLGVVYSQINPSVIGLKFTNADLAYYNKGQNYPQLILNAAGGSVDSVLFPSINQVRDDTNKTLSIFRTIIKAEMFVVFPAMLGLFAVSENLIELLLTEKWLPIVPYLKIFCISYMLDMIANSHMNIAKSYGKTDWLLILEVVRKGASILITLFFVATAKSPIWLAVSLLVGSFISCIVEILPSVYLINYSIMLQIKDAVQNLMPSIIMCAVVSLIGTMNMNIYCILILQVLSGAIIYYGINLLFKNPALQYFLKLLKTKLGRDVKFPKT